MATPVKAGQAYVALGVKDEISKGLIAARKKLESFAKALTSIGQKLFFIGATITSAFLAAARTFSNFGDAIAKTAGRLGIGVDKLQELHFAASRGSVAVEVMNNSLRRMIRRTAEAAKGTGAAVGAFRELKLDPKKLKLLPVEQQLGAIGDALGKVGNHSDKLRLAFQIFDTEGAMMLTVLKDGSAGLAAMAAEAQKLGIILSGEAARDAEAFSDAWGDLKAQLNGIVIQIGAAVVPILVSIIDAIKPLIKTVIDWIKANKELVQNVMLWGAVVAAAGAAFIALGAIIGSFILSFIALKVALLAVLAPMYAILKFIAIRVVFGLIKRAVVSLTTALWNLSATALAVGRTVAMALGRVLIASVMGPLKLFGNLVRGIWAKLIPEGTFKALGAFAKGSFEILVEGITWVLNSVRAGSMTFTRGFVLIAKGIGRFAKTIMRLLPLFGRILKFAWGLQKIPGMILAAFSKVNTFFAAMAIQIARALNGLRGFSLIFAMLARQPLKLLKLIPMVVGLAYKAISSIAAPIARLLMNLFVWSKTAFFGLAGYITGAFGAAWDFIKKVVVGTGKVIKSFISGSVAAFKFFGGLITVTFIEFFRVVKDGFTVLTTGWSQVFSNLGSNLSSLLSNLASTFATTFGGLTDAIMAGEFQLAWEIVVTGLKTAWVQFIEDLRVAWIDFNTDVVKAAAVAAKGLVSVWRKSSQSIAAWLADRFYEWSVGEDNVMTPEELQKIRDQSLNESYDKMEGSANEAIDNLAGEMQKILGEKAGTDPETAARIAALQAQLETLRGDAKTAREEADKARKERLDAGNLPDFDFEGMNFSGAAEDVKTDTVEKGSAEAAEKVRDLLYGQSDYQQKMIERLDALIKLTRNQANKPTVGMA